MENFKKKQDAAFKEDEETFGTLDGSKPARCKDCCGRCKKLFKWYGLLRDLGDEDLKIICGTDCALFLVFERYASQFFAIVTIINMFLFIPLYLTGHRDDKSMTVDQEKVLIYFISALAIMGDSDRDKRIALFVLMIFLFTVLTFGLMYNYWKKSY